MTAIPRLLSLREVCDVTGVKKSTIYKWMNEGRFPQSLKLSPTCVRWKEPDVAKWVNALQHQLG